VTRYRLAHLSDPHIGPLPRPPLASLASKRVFGYLNWVRNRRHALGDEVLAALVDDVALQGVDHVCVTGDLVNIALPAEFETAAAWLAALGTAADVSVVPGNHDAYVPGAAARAGLAWAPFCTGDDGASFPYCRRRGTLAIIGVSTAVATGPLMATGRVGARQRAALAALLDRHDDAFKVVMIHHPPDRALSSGRRGLTDVRAVRDVLASGCVDLVLHGHNHERSLAWLDTPRGHAAVVGVPSASSDGSRHPAGGYALIDVDTERRTARLVRREVVRPGEPVRAVESTDLALRPAPD
jgi:3',5'-cyclic AMP phosphodiesterase CpdA